jgi:malonyl CoA-acyl carrier protein transacylase/acyl carrier protein
VRVEESDVAAVLFPGQGAYDMEALQAAHKEYWEVAEVFADIDKVSLEECGRSLSDVLFGSSSPSVSDLMADEPWVSQLTILGADIAAYRILERLGFAPDVFVGHSLGEIAALVCAGGYSTADGARLVLRRVQALESLDRRDAYMAALATDPRRAQLAIELIADPALAIAVENHDNQTVVVGPGRSMDLLRNVVEQLGISVTRLEAAFPFHGPLLEPAVARYEESIQDIPQRTLTARVYSPILQRYYEPDEPLARRLAEHFVLPVHFSDALRRLYADDIRVFVECGAQETLTKFVPKTLTSGGMLAMGTFVQTETGLRLHTTISTLRSWNHIPATQPVADLGAGEEFDRFWAAFGPRVTEFVRDEFQRYRNGHANGATTVSVPASPPRQVTPPTPAPTNGTTRDSIASEVISLYASWLEYPEEVVTEDVDLEAELGVDSVKQVALMAKVRERYGIERPPDNFRLERFGKLGALIDAVHAILSGTTPAVAAAVTGRG